MLIKIVITLILIILGCWTLCAWIRLAPPANILLLEAKKLYGCMISQTLIAFLVILLAESLLFLYYSINHLATPSFYFYTYLILWIYTLLGFAYCDFIRHAPVKLGPKQSLLEKALHEKTAPLPAFEEKDLSSLKAARQFSFYIPRQGRHQTTCLFYLNYERWHADSGTKDILYLRDLALKEGYSFCIYGGKGVGEVLLPGIVGDIQDALNALVQHTPVEEIILSGTSAGGHLALVTALAKAHPDLFPQNLTCSIGGVLALYPIVDLSDNYVLFTGKDEHCKSFLDHLGDIVYSTLAKDGSFSESYQKVMKEVMGGSYNDLAPLYDCASPRTMLSAQDFPVLMIHGNHDSYCPIESVRRLYYLMREQNKQVAYLELPYVEHGFDTLNVEHSIVGHKIKREISNWLYTYFK